MPWAPPGAEGIDPEYDSLRPPTLQQALGSKPRLFPVVLYQGKNNHQNVDMPALPILGVLVNFGLLHFHKARYWAVVFTVLVGLGWGEVGVLRVLFG